MANFWTYGLNYWETGEDRYMLRCFWQALNPLFIHVTSTAIVLAACRRIQGRRPKCALGWLQKLTHVPLAIAILLVVTLSSSVTLIVQYLSTISDKGKRFSLPVFSDRDACGMRLPVINRRFSHACQLVTVTHRWVLVDNGFLSIAVSSVLSWTSLSRCPWCYPQTSNNQDSCSAHSLRDTLLHPLS